MSRCLETFRVFEYSFSNRSFNTVRIQHPSRQWFPSVLAVPPFRKSELTWYPKRHFLSLRKQKALNCSMLRKFEATFMNRKISYLWQFSSLWLNFQMNRVVSSKFSGSELHINVYSYGKCSLFIKEYYPNLFFLPYSDLYLCTKRIGYFLSSLFLLTNVKVDASDILNWVERWYEKNSFLLICLKNTTFIWNSYLSSL